jgi:hypothetical protein
MEGAARYVQLRPATALGEETILRVGNHHGSRAIFVIVRHVVDATNWIFAPARLKRAALLQSLCDNPLASVDRFANVVMMSSRFARTTLSNMKTF